MEVAITYLIIGITITLLLMITGYLKPNSFDELSMRNIIERVIGWTILWPILVCHTLPKHGTTLLFQKYEDNSFDVKKAINNRETDLFSLWQSPPACSNDIEINGYDESTYENLSSKLRFNACNVLNHLNELSPESEFSVFNQEAIILKWINQRSIDDNNVCTVPEELDRFNSIANSLLCKGQGRVFCKDCQTEYSPNQLEYTSDDLSAGWNFERIKCSNGHLVSVVKGIHLKTNSN
jgi:hypothetical protein